ncbi:glycosyltransferase family 4 protein [Gordonia sp. CPCC 205515]|uniref:glycosyltransferase family 4 protein n=1 Tax=Gordonia sp. CPCC 205515 TaxID=3140791 RepID=UPI003AF3B521
MEHSSTTPPASHHTPLRVLVLDQGPGLWGAQQYLLRLRPLMAEHDVDLTLACPPELEQYEHWRTAGFPVIPLALPVSRSIRYDDRISPLRVGNELRRSLTVPRLIADTAHHGRFDVILANSHWTHLDAAVAGRIGSVPAVLTLHETTIPGVGRRLRDGAIRLAGHSIAVSKSVAETVGSRARRRVTVIPNGVDTIRFAPADRARRQSIRTELGLSDAHRVVLAATRLDPTKHIEDLIALAAGLDDGATVLVAGATSVYSEYERAMRADAERLTAGRLRFLGARSDVDRLLAAADVYAHTGLVEGMPLGVIEAQAAGVPVVAYEAAGVREAVRHNRSGYVVAPRDVAGLLAATWRLIDSTSLRAEFGDAAREHALAHHQLTDQAAANARLLRSVVGSVGRTRAVTAGAR